MHVIEVTQADIDAGVRGEIDACPIALAANRALGITDTWVTNFGRMLPGPNANWLMPPKAVAFQRAYDKGKPVVPFTFKVPFEPRSR